MKILIRFDDICPTMDFEQFEIAMRLMDKYDIKPLLGVIPKSKDPDLLISKERIDFWDFIQSLQEKGYTIAMHGVNHVFDSLHHGFLNKRMASEFAGHTLENQISKIKEGKEILNSHGISTDIFFAPAHSYDINTIKALSANGFKYISDGKSSLPYEFEGVISLPCRSSGCPVIRNNSFYTAVFHAHEWAWENKKYCYDEFVNLIEKHHDKIVSFDEYKNQRIGNYAIQKIIEAVYVGYHVYIRPFLSSCLRKIK